MKLSRTAFLMFSPSINSATVPIFSLTVPPVAAPLSPALAFAEPRCLSMICMFQIPTLEGNDFEFFSFFEHSTNISWIVFPLGSTQNTFVVYMFPCAISPQKLELLGHERNVSILIKTIHSMLLSIL